MYRRLNHIYLLLLSILSVLVVIFQNPLAAAAMEKEPLTAECEALLKDIPHSDLIYDWNKKDIPQLEQWLKHLNSAFSGVIPFTDQQIRDLLIRISHLHEEQMQLRHLLDHKFITEQSVQILPGQMGEWEQPIYEWLQSILKQPEQTRQQIEDRQKQHEPRGPLNPIQQHRYKKLIQDVATLEAKLGQKIMTDEELEYGALEDYFAQRIVESLERYLDAKISSDISILELKQKFITLNSISHSMDRFGDIDGLTAKVAAMNNPEIFAEIDFYVSLVQSENFTSDRGEMMQLRFLSWYHGENPSFQQSLHDLILQEVKKLFEIHSTHGLNPHYIGNALLYSIGETLGKETRDRGMEVMQTNLESIDWNQATTTFLGSWETSTIPRLLGLPLDFEKDKEYKRYLYMYGVEFKDSHQIRRYTVQVEPHMAEDHKALPIEAASYRTLIGLSIKEIRETLLTPRAQDGFPTVPVDLMEPLVELTESNGRNIFRVLPTQILFSHLPLPPEEAKQKISDHNLTHRVADAMTGGPDKGEYVKLRFFHMNKQLIPEDLFLHLVMHSSNIQAFAASVKEGPLSHLLFFLERNLLNDNYTLSVRRDVGVGRFKFATAIWEGKYQPPRR